MFLALVLLFVKHFICDYPLQTSAWMYLNKGTYLHLGGLAHSALHGIATWLILVYFIGEKAWLYALVDFLIHYHIDWLKVNLNQKLNYKPETSNGFWILLGLDQLAHHLTYLAIIYYAFNLKLT